MQAPYMQAPYMRQIVSSEKIYEFRKYCLKNSVERIWFYRTSPNSSLDYVCEILPARTRNPGDLPLEDVGLGNREFNTRHKDWEGYDYAYKIKSVCKLDSPISLHDLKAMYDIKSAPRGLVYAPSSLTDQVQWRKQSKVR